jgi:EpsD family peptidyl-prolyl cis-trans isomerase
MTINKTSCTAVAVAAAVLLGGCGEKPASTKEPLQVAATVNKAEITVHQINSTLARTAAGGSGDQVKGASAELLERLIDEELLVQRAVDRKLDRRPEVLHLLEAARRQVLAQAALGETTASIAKPTAQQVSAFYAEHPDLFAQRRVYRVREVAVTASGEQVKVVEGLAEKARSMNEFVAALKAQGIVFADAASTKPAEQIALQLLPRLARLKDNQWLVVPGAAGPALVQVLESQIAPVSEKQATPFIEQYLMNQEKLRVAQAEVKRLRAAAKIQYVGDFQPASIAPPVRQADAAAPAVEQGARDMK